MQEKVIIQTSIDNVNNNVNDSFFSMFLYPFCSFVVWSGRVQFLVRVCSMFARWGSIPQRSWCLVTLLFIGEPNLKALHSPPWVGLDGQFGRHCTALTGAWPFALNIKNLPDAGESLVSQVSIRGIALLSWFSSDLLVVLLQFRRHFCEPDFL